MIKENEIYRIGTIGKPHGTRGELTMRFEDDVFMRSDCPYLVLIVEGLPVPFFVEEARQRGAGSALVCLEGVDTLEKARQLTGTAVCFPLAEAEAAGGPAMAASVEGYTIADADSGKEIGRVSAVDNTTANVLLVTERGEMIPAAEGVVVGVDHGSRTISVRLPDGLLDI